MTERSNQGRLRPGLHVPHRHAVFGYDQVLPEISAQDQLPDDPVAILGASLSFRSGVIVQGIGVPLAGEHLLTLRAADNFDQMVDGEIFLIEARSRAEALHALHDAFGQCRHVHCGIVASLAVIAGRGGLLAECRVKDLSEVLKLQDPPAVALVLAVPHHAVEVVVVNAPRLEGRLLVGVYEFSHAVHVGVRVEEDALGLAAVPASTTRFLVVSLDALGQREVYDEADVRFVDAHAEGDGGAHHQDASLDPPVLNRTPLAVA